MEGGIEVLHQPKLLTEYAGIPIKVMLDFVLVDHNAKKIYIKDLKTTGAPEYLFYKSFVKWNYDIQAELYKYAVETVIKTDEAFKDYSVEPFAFIVVNKKFLQPMEWQYEPEKYLVSEQAAKQVGLSNWRGLLMSLDYEKALSVPMGMTTNEPNDLMAFIVNSAHSQGMDVDIVEANDDSIA